MRTTVEATAEETAGVLAFTFEEGGEHWPTVGGVKVPWETCQTFSGSWGYARDELTWKPPEELLTILIQSVSKGGNLIMNVGPTARVSAIPGSNAFLVFRVGNPDKDAYGWIYVHFGFPFINETPCINCSVHPGIVQFLKRE